MALERTFSIIKPDATRRNLTGKINAKFCFVAQAAVFLFIEIRVEADYFVVIVHFVSFTFGKLDVILAKITVLIAIIF